MLRSIHRRALAAGAAVVGALTLAACTGGAAAASGDGTEWPTSITIVQMPAEDNPATATLHDSFRAGLQEHLGIEVEEMVGMAFGPGLEAMRAGHLEILFVTPMSYHFANQLADVEPLVTWTVAEDAATYKSVFITRADSDIETIEDLAGRTFAFVDPASSSGFMYPTAHLVTELGVDPDQVLNPGYFFDNVVFSGAHPNSVMGLLMGDFEAATVAYAILGMLVDSGQLDLDDVRIVGYTQTIPQPMFIIRGDLPADLIETIREFYLAFEDEDYFEALHGSRSVRFVPVDPTAYDVVGDMIRILNLEPQ